MQQNYMESLHIIKLLKIQFGMNIFFSVLSFYQTKSSAGVSLHSSSGGTMNICSKFHCNSSSVPIQRVFQLSKNYLI